MRIHMRAWSEGSSWSSLRGESSYRAASALAAAFEPRDLAHVFVLSDGLRVNGSEAFFERTGVRRLDKPFDAKSLRDIVGAVAAGRQEPT